ncbi:hypothetical protein GCM10023332_04150 [Luteimonas vadosa]|uniref:TonB C-terminal domain-containing protein n=2 Tax=Luteimonas vadosa TaxID=1165507 RepID=A0ABP9DPJ0_9GAMM
MKRGAWLAMVLWACAAGAFAAGKDEARKQAESSMLVTGTVDIDAEGRVERHALDKPEALPPAVVELVDRHAPGWRFEPVAVDGKPVKARAKMSLRLVATKLADDAFQLRIRSGVFGGDGTVAREQQVTSAQMRPPEYPPAAYWAGVQGTVYLVLRIGRDGKVEDSFAEQVNLTVVGTDKQMRSGREALAGAAMKAARRWRFVPPRVGSEADAEFWSVRVPVEFTLADSVGSRRGKYGQWDTYVPGPRQTAPWLLEELNASDSPDSYAANGVHPVGEGLRLLTPLGDG